MVLFIYFFREESPELFSIAAAPIYNLQSHQQCVRIPFFSTSSPTLVICGLLNDTHSFCLHFPDD